MVWFLKSGRRFCVRFVNAYATDEVRIEAQRRIDEQGVIGIQEGGRGDYIFGHPGITIWSIVEYGAANELADRDRHTELESKGLVKPLVDPDIPFWVPRARTPLAFVSIVAACHERTTPATIRSLCHIRMIPFGKRLFAYGITTLTESVREL